MVRVVLGVLGVLMVWWWNDPDATYEHSKKSLCLKHTLFSLPPFCVSVLLPARQAPLRILQAQLVKLESFRFDFSVGL